MLSCRHTMIRTTEYCELLYLEAANIRRIYETHKTRMERLLLQVNSSNVSDDSVDGHDRERGVAAAAAAPDSELAMAGVTLYQLIRDHFKELIG